MNNIIELQKLPLQFEVESRAVLKKTILARSSLAELKGSVKALQDDDVIIQTLILQESRFSCLIEGISCKNNDLFQGDYDSHRFLNNQVRDVLFYNAALINGWKEVGKSKRLSINDILKIQGGLMNYTYFHRATPPKKRVVTYHPL